MPPLLSDRIELWDRSETREISIYSTNSPKERALNKKVRSFDLCLLTIQKPSVYKALKRIPILAGVVVWT